MKSISYRSFQFLFSLGIFIYSSLPSAGQELNLKSGSVIEKEIIRGESQKVQVADSRGTLQWQQSGDGITWNDRIGKTETSIEVIVNENLYLRCAIREDNCDPVYSDVLKLLPITLPTVTTGPVNSVTTIAATGGGDVTHDGNSTVTERGVCWSTSRNPTIADNKTIDGRGPGSFTSNLDGLTSGMPCFVRAYATNRAGTSYGEEKKFTTARSVDCDGTFTDDRDGHEYCYKTIGTQTWMTENLAYLPSVSLSSEGSISSSVYYVYGYQGNDVTAAKAGINHATYGVLYNWEAARTACPTGWYLPGDEDWKILEKFQGMSESDASLTGWRDSGAVGGKLKESGTANWNGPDTGASNSSFFTILPGGIRTNCGGFRGLGGSAYFWMATAYGETIAWYRSLYNDDNGVHRYSGSRGFGFSVRCLQEGTK